MYAESSLKLLIDLVPVSLVRRAGWDCYFYCGGSDSTVLVQVPEPPPGWVRNSLMHILANERCLGT
jgi:hypothetical protein